MAGHRQTLAGLSGLGDLVLTCTGSLSRNRAVGIELGRGRQLPDVLAGMHGKVAEGVRSTTAALGLAARYGVEMPITQSLDQVLHHGKNPREAMRESDEPSGAGRVAVYDWAGLPTRLARRRPLLPEW